MIYGASGLNSGVLGEYPRREPAGAGGGGGFELGRTEHLYVKGHCHLTHRSGDFAISHTGSIKEKYRSGNKSGLGKEG